MLPQKLGLDVVVEKETDRLVTLEINGERSGYYGLVSVGEDLSWRIMQIMGESLRGRKILVNTNIFHEFIPSPFTVENMKRLREEYGVVLGFAPNLLVPLSAEQFEAATGVALADYGALIGFGRYIRDSGLDERMINTPSVELVTWDKLLQYALLQKVPGLNMPETRYFDTRYSLAAMRKFQSRHGTVVQKPRHGSQGNGVSVLKENEFGLTTIIEFPLQGFTRLELFKKFGYKGRDNDAAMNAFILELSKRNKGDATSLVSEVLRNNSLSLPFSLFSFLYANAPEFAHERAKARLDVHGTLLQRFIETEPVVHEETGEPHFAKARLLWFGEYLGGYWALSSNPVSRATRDDFIINYSKTFVAQRFTPEEAERFRRYAESVVPKVLRTLAPQSGKLREYESIEARIIKETMLSKVAVA